MRVESLGHGSSPTICSRREERADEFLLMGLRLAEGIDPARYQALAGRPLDPERIATLTAHGFVESDGDGLPARHAGRLPGARRGGGRSGGLTPSPRTAGTATLPSIKGATHACTIVLAYRARRVDCHAMRRRGTRRRRGERGHAVARDLRHPVLDRRAARATSRTRTSSRRSRSWRTAARDHRSALLNGASQFSIVGPDAAIDRRHARAGRCASSPASCASRRCS